MCKYTAAYVHQKKKIPLGTGCRKVRFIIKRAEQTEPTVLVFYSFKLRANLLFLSGKLLKNLKFVLDMGVNYPKKIIEYLLNTLYDIISTQLFISEGWIFMVFNEYYRVCGRFIGGNV